MATGIRVSMTGQHEWHVMGECWDLPVGFVGIGLEKSISVTECDNPLVAAGGGQSLHIPSYIHLS